MHPECSLKNSFWALLLSSSSSWAQLSTPFRKAVVVLPHHCSTWPAGSCGQHTLLKALFLQLWTLLSLLFLFSTHLLLGILNLHSLSLRLSTPSMAPGSANTGCWWQSWLCYLCPVSKLSGMFKPGSGWVFPSQLLLHSDSNLGSGSPLLGTLLYWLRSGSVRFSVNIHVHMILEDIDYAIRWMAWNLLESCSKYISETHLVCKKETFVSLGMCDNLVWLDMCFLG